eukprot:COSAG06_NODE_1275_length_10046_cov_4.285915_13_plen_237_part_00
MCELAEGVTSNLEGTVASAATWQQEKTRLEAEALASRDRIAALEQSLEMEREDSKAAQLEIKRWMEMHNELTAAAGAVDADADVDGGGYAGGGEPASPNMLAATAVGDEICQAAAEQALAQSVPAAPAARSELSVTFDQTGPLGMNLTSCSVGDGVMVLAIQPNTQAAEGNASELLRTGLVISAVADRPVAGLSYQEVTDAIAGHPARPLTIRFWVDDDDDESSGGAAAAAAADDD